MTRGGDMDINTFFNHPFFQNPVACLAAIVILSLVVWALIAAALAGNY